MINTSIDINDRPCAFRYPRGNGIGVELPSIDEKLKIGKGRVVQEGTNVCILSLGTRLEECKIAAKELKNKKYNVVIIIIATIFGLKNDELIDLDLSNINKKEVFYNVI